MFILVMLFSILHIAVAEENKTNPVSIGIVMPVGGSGDLSFEWTATEGITKINQELYGVEITTREPLRVDMLKICYEDLIASGSDLIIGIGFLHEKVMDKVAREHPEVKFAIIDAKIDLPNVTSVTFREEEGSFLAGCTAAMVTKTGKVGFIGGMKSGIIEKFRIGYEEGAKYIKPDILVETKYIGQSEDAFSAPNLGKKLAKEMYENDVDIIFTAAGGSGLGVIEIARIKNKYCIGVDSDQDYIAPGNVVTSMMKRVDNAMYLIVKDYIDGKFKTGNVELGLKEGGISLSEFKYTQEVLTKEQFKKLDEIQDDIINGKITIKI